MALACRDLTISFTTGSGPVPALDRVTFQAREHELVCLVGPSGCGKTTLLRLLAGLLQPDSGEAFPGVPAPGGPPGAALVFQDHGLFPWMTVLENVAFGLESRGVGRRARTERARTAVERLGLGPFADRFPFQLSVGMCQRVGIARAFLSDAPVLLMDEPFASVDAQTRRVLQEELLRLWREDSKTVLFVTHDIGEAVALGDRVLVMSGRPGRVLADIPVSLPRPRVPDDVDCPEAATLRRRVWEMMEPQVRRDLGLEP